MKTQLAVKSIGQALALTNKTIGKRTTLPILGTVLLRTQGDSLQITGTDLDVTCAVSLPAGLGRAGNDGAICAPAHRMADILKTCSHDVEIETNDKAQLAIRNGSQFSLDCLSAEEFPAICALKNPRMASVKVGDLRRALRRVEYAQSTDAARYVLNGCLLKFTKDQLTIVGTDGRRMAISELFANWAINADDSQNIVNLTAEIARLKTAASSMEKKAQAFDEIHSGKKSTVDSDRESKALWKSVVSTEEKAKATQEKLNAIERPQFILPAKAVSVIQSSLPKASRKNTGADDAEIVIQWDADYSTFTFNNGEHTVQITSKLIQGNYPNYKHVIPGEAKERIRFDREAFLHAIETADKLTTEKANSVKLTFSANLLTVTANSPGNGQAAATVPINYAGKEFAIAFNPAYLIDALQSLDVAEIVGEFIDELSPGVFKIQSQPWLYVVMPMRLS